MTAKTLNTKLRPPADNHQLAIAAGRRAANLFSTGQLWCAEAVFCVLNRSLGGGLSSETAQRLASGLGQGIGAKGCLCGALSGGALALGLFLGDSRPGWNTNAKIMDLCGRLHDRFRNTFGATCCRSLTRSFKEGSPEHIRRCSLHTATAATMAAEIILHRLPHLGLEADLEYLSRSDSKLAAIKRRLVAPLLSRLPRRLQR